MGSVEKDVLSLFRLKIHIEFDQQDSECGSQAEFEALCQNAIQRLLGQAAPEYYIEKNFDSDKQRGSLILSGQDLNIIWAALSCYGQHLGSAIAIHMQEIAQVKQRLNLI